ncbi:MAG: Homoserine O-acetyltransferase [Fibrobacterota bacterium]|jgi:homoserine O-acetyltransferase
MSIAEDTGSASAYDWTRSVGVVETHLVRLVPQGGFPCERGETLPELEIAYETYGVLNAARDNVVMIAPALTAGAHVAGFHGSRANLGTKGWWDAMVGPGKPIDTNRWFVVCSSLLGGCSGTTGPLSINPLTGHAYGYDFPDITIGDMVEVQKRLLDHLGISALHGIVGGSLGGMQALEWSLRYPGMVGHCAVIAATASLSAQNLAFDIIARNAILHDEGWQGGHYLAGQGPERGLSLARQLAHITYLSSEGMDRKFGRQIKPSAQPERFHTAFEVESYLDYQGRKFVQRFDANAYLRITHAMDNFDLAATYGTSAPADGASADPRKHHRMRLGEAFARSRCSYLIVALKSDWLFPSSHSWEMAEVLLELERNVSFCELDGDGGHDGFLIEAEAKPLEALLAAFLGDPTKVPVRAIQQNEHQARAEDRAVIASLVKPGSRVLDVGCGDGELLDFLRRERACTGIGVDIDRDAVTATLAHGIPALQTDVDDNLHEFADGSFDCVVLNNTLQAVGKPDLVLEEIVRVGREAIVSFPNFGHWSCILPIALKGRMPRTKTLAFEWYDTPNLHFFTTSDFLDFCERKGIEVMEIHPICSDLPSRLLARLGLDNLAAERVIARLRRKAKD